MENVNLVKNKIMMDVGTKPPTSNPVTSQPHAQPREQNRGSDTYQIVSGSSFRLST